MTDSYPKVHMYCPVCLSKLRELSEIRISEFVEGFYGYFFENNNLF